MKPFRLTPAAGWGILLLFAGCATPQYRISKNPAAFDRLPAEQQAMVQKGEVGLGFAPEAVQLALGAPDRIRHRENSSGQSETWTYLAFDSIPHDSGYYRFSGDHDFGGRWNFYGLGRNLDYWSYSEVAYPQLRVTFHDGRVTELEEQKR